MAPGYGIEPQFFLPATGLAQAAHGRTALPLNYAGQKDHRHRDKSL
jgi:hypothetical protein